MAFPKYVHILNPEPCKYGKIVFADVIKELVIKIVLDYLDGP